MISTARAARPVFRDSRLQTFSTIAVPGVTWEHCTCVVFGCAREANGWVVRLDESLPVARLRADYIRNITSRKGWTVEVDESGEVTVFEFPPGTPCFQDARDRRAQAVFEVGPHRRQIRHALHVVSAGGAVNVQKQITGRGRPESLLRAHTRPQDWLEHLAGSWNQMAHHINT